MKSRMTKATTTHARGESGAILIEAIVGLVIFTIAILSAAQFLRWNVEPLLQKERQEKAGKQAESLLNELAGKKQADLPAAAAFGTSSAGASAGASPSASSPLARPSRWRCGSRRSSRDERGKRKQAGKTRQG